MRVTNALPLRLQRLRTTALAAVAVGLGLASAACDSDSASALDELRGAFPDSETLAVTLPDDEDLATATAGLGMAEGALVGEASGFRNTTLGARRFLTKGIGELLDAFERIVTTRPKLDRGDHIVWFNRAAPGYETLVVANRKSDGHWVFTAWIRDRFDLAARPLPAWRFLAGGSLTPGTTLGDGRGAVWINLDNDRKLATKGKVIVLYDERDGVRDLEVRAFSAVTEDGEAVTRGYRFHSDGAGGLFAFDGGLQDVHKNPNKPGLEHIRYTVRWNPARRVRADRVATGDEITADGFRAAVQTECWQAGEGVVLFTSRVAFPLGNGAPVLIDAAGAPGLCPFGDVGPAALPEPVEEPPTPDAPPETDASVDWEP